VGEVDFCPACGYDFLSNSDTFVKPEQFPDIPEAVLSLRWEEDIRLKPVRTGLVYLGDRLFLAKEAVEGFIKKYNRVRKFAKGWLPEEHSWEGEKSYILFEWDSNWVKLGEWLKGNPGHRQRVRIWNHIASFVHLCHQNGLIVNQFHPNCIWIDPDQVTPVFEALEFIATLGDREVIIYNEGLSSPEVREGKWETVSFPADIYCLGRLLRLMLGLKEHEVRERIFEANVDSFSGLGLLSRHLGFGIGKCLRDQASERWSNIAQLFEHLQERELEPVNLTGFTHMGFRELNEDAIYYSNRRIRCLEHSYDTAIAVLADGMGGLEQGEVASNSVVQMISAELERKINGQLMGPKGQAPDSNPEAIFDLIRETITGCNMALVRQSADSDGQMGSTAVAVVIINHYLYMGYVGDSRLYIFDETGRIHFVSEDHSLIGKREAIGDISEAEALAHPDKNVLYQAVGLKESIRVDTYGVKLKPGWKVMLCSDGISGCFLKHELMELLEAHPDIITLADALFYEALERNSLDNYSLILAEVVKGRYLDEYRFELVAAPGECGFGDGTLHELLPAGDSEPGSSGPDPGGY
jgi:protein phosphatase